MSQKKILFNYLSYFLCFLLLIIIGITNVFADTYTNIGYLSDKTQVQVAVTYATESQAPLTVNKDQVYNIPGISDIIISINNYSFSANTIYEIEFNIPYSTFNNNLNSVSVIGGTSSGCAYISTSNLDGHYPRVRFSCTNASNGLTITFSNTNHQNIITSTSSSQTGGSDFRWNYTYLILVNVTQDTTIIEQNNQIINQNSQIIQGQQDIIDNQTQNTQDIINSNRVCETIDKNSIEQDNKVIYDTGVNNNSNFGITKYVKIDSDTDIKVLQSRTGYAMYCFYDINKTQLSCGYNNTLVSGNTLTIPTNASYFRASIQKSENKPTFEICKNGNQALNDSITGLDSTLNDDDTNGATSEATDFFETFTTDTFGLTSIITAPLNLIQSLLSTGSICQVLHIPLPYLDNKYLDLPCMYTIYRDTFGVVFTMYQTITYGVIAYWVCVRIFNLVKDFKNPEHDEIEVLDL